MSLLNLVGLIPKSYLIGGVAILLAISHGYAYHKGQQSIEREWDAAIVQRIIKQQAMEIKQVNVTAIVEQKHAVAAAKTKVIFKTLIKEVKIYVPEIADSACVINAGWLLLHDSAAAGILPNPTSAFDGTAPGGVELSEIAEVVVSNYNMYYEVLGQLVALQEWVREQQRIAAVE